MFLGYVLIVKNHNYFLKNHNYFCGDIQESIDVYALAKSEKESIRLAKEEFFRDLESKRHDFFRNLEWQWNDDAGFLSWEDGDCYSEYSITPLCEVGAPQDDGTLTPLCDRFK